jgi:hypothetical protein
MDALELILAWFIDFLITTICFWLVLLLLSIIGVAIPFSWGKAIAVWMIVKVLKLLF